MVFVPGAGTGSWQNPARKPRRKRPAGSGKGTTPKGAGPTPAGKRFKGNPSYGFLETDPKQYPSTKGKDSRTGKPMVLKPKPKPKPAAPKVKAGAKSPVRRSTKKK